MTKYKKIGILAVFMTLSSDADAAYNRSEINKRIRYEAIYAISSTVFKENLNTKLKAYIKNKCWNEDVIISKKIHQNQNGNEIIATTSYPAGRPKRECLEKDMMFFRTKTYLGFAAILGFSTKITIKVRIFNIDQCENVRIAMAKFNEKNYKPDSNLEKEIKTVMINENDKLSNTTEFQYRNRMQLK